MDDPSSSTTCVNVSGTTFHVPSSLYAYLKDLPDENRAKNVHDGVVVVKLNADPNAFRWLLYYHKHKSLPTTFWQEEEDVKTLESLAVTLGMAELVLYVGNHTSPRQSFLRSNLKRSSSWQKRAREHGKRKLDALAATILTKGGGSIRKLKSSSYEELVQQSPQHVM